MGTHLCGCHVCYQTTKDNHFSGKYEQPFAEYGLAVEYAIIVAATSGKRPTLPNGTPNQIAQAYLKCVHPDPNERPTAAQLGDMIRVCIYAFGLIFRDSQNQLKLMKSHGHLKFMFLRLLPQLLQAPPILLIQPQHQELQNQLSLAGEKRTNWTILHSTFCKSLF